MTPVAPWATWARGAAARNSFIEPHSSASTWLNAIHRSRSRPTIRSTSADTTGNSARMPVW